MRGESYTPAVLTAFFWNAATSPQASVGGFLQTNRGTTYRIDKARELPSGSVRLEVTRWPADEVPDDALVIAWEWTKRERKTGRT